jgi:hypothetical protein
MIGMTLLGMLLTAIFWLYSSGAAAWGKADDKIEVLREMQLATTRMEQQIEQSIYSTLSIQAAPPAVSFASADDASGSFTTNVDLAVWQRYIVVYYDATKKTLEGFGKPFNIPTSTANPIEAWNFGSGVHPLGFYLATPTTENRFTIRNVVNCRFVGEDRLLITELEAHSDQHGRTGGGTFKIRSVAYFRNQ